MCVESVQPIFDVSILGLQVWRDNVPLNQRIMSACSTKCQCGPKWHAASLSMTAVHMHIEINIFAIRLSSDSGYHLVVREYPEYPQSRELKPVSLASHTTFFSSHCCQSSLEKPLEMPPSTMPCSEVSRCTLQLGIPTSLTLKSTVGVT